MPGLGQGDPASTTHGPNAAPGAGIVDAHPGTTPALPMPIAAAALSFFVVLIILRQITGH